MKEINLRCLPRKIKKSDKVINKNKRGNLVPISHSVYSLAVGGWVQYQITCGYAGTDLILRKEKALYSRRNTAISYLAIGNHFRKVSQTSIC